MIIHELKLAGHRCPDALRLVRSALLKAAKDEVLPTVLIRTIEPSLTRDLPQLLAKSPELPWKLTQQETAPLSESGRADLMAQGFDEEDLANAPNSLSFLLQPR